MNFFVDVRRNSLLREGIMEGEAWDTNMGPGPT